MRDLILQLSKSSIYSTKPGRSAAPDVSDPTKHNYLDALKAAFENIAVPVLYDVDIGHIPPQISLVNGADATVFFAENGSWVTQQL